MGPSVKFVSRINASFSKKIWEKFFRKKYQTGVGGGRPRGAWQKTTLFTFFSRTLPLFIECVEPTIFKEIISTNKYLFVTYYVFVFNRSTYYTMNAHKCTQEFEQTRQCRTIKFSATINSFAISFLQQGFDFF